VDEVMTARLAVGRTAFCSNKKFIWLIIIDTAGRENF